MNHEQFRLAAGADPQHLSDEQVQHLASCAECRRYHAELVALEVRLGAALKIPVPATQAGSIAAITGGRAHARPRIWQYGLAATLALASLVASLLFLGHPQESLAYAAAMHAAGEPESFLTSAPEDPAALRRVMATEGLELLPGGPMVTYARNCPLRGHTIAHLVVHAAHGPVVVLVMTHEKVDAQRAFSEHGYRGVLVPAPRGSLAVLGASDEDLAQVVAAVNARIRYL